MWQIKQKSRISCGCVSVLLFAILGLILMISGFVVYGTYRDGTLRGDAGGFIAGSGALIIGISLMIVTCGWSETQS